MGFLAAIPAVLAATASTVGTAVAGGTVAAGAASSAAITLAATSAVVGAAGVAYSAIADARARSYQAQVAANNAIIAKQNANSTLEQGNVEESNMRQLTSRRVGGALAAQGASGIDVGFGTPVEARVGLQNTGDLDAAAIRYTAVQRALGYANQSAGFTAESSLQKQAAGSALAGGVLGVGSTLIGGASSVAKSKLGYLQYQAGGGVG